MGTAGGVFEAVDRIGGQPISARMARRAPIKHLDPTLLLTTLALGAFGAVMVFTATASKLEDQGLDPGLFLKRQVIFGAVGAALLLAVSFFDYRYWRAFAPFVFGASLIALVVVLSPLGDVQEGARRWINFGAFQAQPSELAKIGGIVALAAYVAERKGDLRTLDVLVACGIVAVPMGLIFLEPDLGTAVSFVALLGGALLVGGAKLRHFLMLAFFGVAGAFVMIQGNFLHDYQVERLTAFLDPNPDVRSEGWNLAQSKIAIGSGGMTGKGLESENTQTTLDFVPEQHTDFIFTAVGEQLGFLGSAVLLGLFVFLIWRALRIAALSRDLFGTLLASGIAALWSFQVFINVGMTMGIMPITGIPLPFISYGGSSLITHFLAVGLLLNIHMRRYL